MRYSLTTKLAAGFSLCVMLSVSIVAFNYTALLELGKNYDNSLKRSVDMELATDSQHIGEDLYLVIANAVINRDMAKTERDWSESKNQSIVKLKMLAAAADTPEEQAMVAQALGAFNEIVHIYEQEMLPLIKSGGVVPGPLAEIDERIDTHIADIDRSLTWVAKSISAENQESSKDFHAILMKIGSFGLTISLIGVLVAIYISIQTTRKIVRPIAELTKASREIEKGNYLVELKHQSNDETGVLADAFRNMSEQVAKRTIELHSTNEQLRHEISRRKLADEQLQKSHDELELRVEERTGELSHANNLLLQETSMRRKANDELMKSREQLRYLAANLQSIREEERTSIARNIHDDLGQTLTALKMDLSLIVEDLSDTNKNEVAERLKANVDIINTTIQTVKTICTKLRPSILDHFGLGAAIQWQAAEFQRRTGIDCKVTVNSDNLITDKDLASGLFRIFQESLTNVLQHAKATKVKAILTEQFGNIILVITDNGIGITEEQMTNPDSLGLLGIRERVRSWQGEFAITHSQEQGTTIKVVIPAPGQESFTSHSQVEII